jgi:hypothetical protein
MAHHATHYDPWSEADEQTIRARWYDTSLLEIGQLCNPVRTASCVQKKGDRIGLPRKTEPKKVIEVAKPKQPTYEEWFATLSPEEQEEERSWRAFIHWEPPERIIPPPEHVSRSPTCQMIMNWDGLGPVPRPVVFCGKPTTHMSFCPECAKTLYVKRASNGPVNYSAIPSHL